MRCWHEQLAAVAGRPQISSALSPVSEVNGSLIGVIPTLDLCAGVAGYLNVRLLSECKISFDWVKASCALFEGIVFFFLRFLQASPASNLVSEFPLFLQKSSEATSSSSSPPSQADRSRQEVQIFSILSVVLLLLLCSCSLLVSHATRRHSTRLCFSISPTHIKLVMSLYHFHNPFFSACVEWSNLVTGRANRLLQLQDCWFTFWMSYLLLKIWIRTRRTLRWQNCAHVI